MLEEDANTGAIRPLIKRLLGLEGVGKDIHWGAKGMEVAEIDFGLKTREL